MPWEMRKFNCRQMPARDAPCHSIRTGPRPQRRSDGGQNDLETAMDHTDTGREEPAICKVPPASKPGQTDARTVTIRDTPMWCASRLPSMSGQLLSWPRWHVHIQIIQFCLARQRPAEEPVGHIVGALSSPPARAMGSALRSCELEEPCRLGRGSGKCHGSGCAIVECRQDVPGHLRWREGD
jgi:hypothetical protein